MLVNTGEEVKMNANFNPKSQTKWQYMMIWPYKQHTESIVHMTKYKMQKI